MPASSPSRGAKTPFVFFSRHEPNCHKVEKTNPIHTNEYVNRIKDKILAPNINQKYTFPVFHFSTKKQ